MNATQHLARRGRLRAVACVLAVIACHGANAFNSGSTGADGALAPSSNVEVVLPPSGILNYTTINVPSGVTVTFRRNASNTPVQLLASGNVNIAGTIDVRGANAADVGTAGGGAQANDGKGGAGGPGGFEGGNGGKARTYPVATAWSGGPGLGPGGARGGVSLANGDWASYQCFDFRYGYNAYRGMGAGYATLGEKPSECSATESVAGQIYGAPAIQPLIGGSGGGGGAGNSSFGGAGGGGGGGAVMIASSTTLTVTGTILADGGYGGGAASPEYQAIGGNGSGGAIRLVASTLAGTGSLFARAQCHPTYGCGSYTTASAGRIRLEGDTITFSGQTNPTATRDVPGPVTYANLPAIRIATIAGQAVPANPTGVRDVTFPSVTNPVTVEFATTNIPPGNTIKLRVVPANGVPVEALSPAITGTTANGTASVSINLPNGASSLLAIASFTVAVAMGDSLSRYAANERVERIELVTAPGGPSQTYLVTTTGKRHPVSPQLLQALGVLG